MGKFVNKPTLDHLIFGGSFDPPHKGHQSIIKYVIEHNICHNLTIIPAALSPFKKGAPPVAAQHRISMLHLLCQQLSAPIRKRIHIDTYEIDRPPPSYSIETLRFMQNQLTRTKIGLLIGSDSAQHIHRWHKAPEILQNFPLVIFKRTNDQSHILKNINNFILEKKILLKSPVVLLENSLIDCSSSQIRTLIKNPVQSKQLAKCISCEIYDYITQHHLFADTPLNTDL